jgi:hypothetical protein
MKNRKVNHRIVCITIMEKTSPTHSAVTTILAGSCVGNIFKNIFPWNSSEHFNFSLKISGTRGKEIFSCI